MRKYSSNLAFVDLLFNLLVGFTSLFVIAFLLINPIAKKGVVDPPVRMILELTWDDASHNDMDLYVKGPDGTIVFYTNLSNGYINLERDDLGFQTDLYTINGKRTSIRRNYEVTTMTALPDGDYVVNVHFYSKKKGQPEVENINVRVTDLQPFQVVYDAEVELVYFQETTVLVFKVINGKIVDKRTDIQVKLRQAPTSTLYNIYTGRL